MSSGGRKRSATSAHEWTDFEMHTLLCLMVKGTHLEGRASRKDEEGAAKRNAYLDLATKLNKAVHREDYVNDIDKKDITNMIDKVLVERKGVVGRGGYMERSTHPRITRGLKKAWERSPAIDFDGSLSEWNMWRKASEAEKERIRKGGAPMIADNSVSAENDQVQRQAAPVTQNTHRSNNGALWRQVDVAQTVNPSKWRGRKTQTSAPTTDPVHYPKESRPQADTENGREGFGSIPSKLRGTDAFSWALPHASSYKNSSYVSHRSSGRVLTAGPSNSTSEYSSWSQQPVINTYHSTAHVSGEFDSSRPYPSQTSNNQPWTTNASSRMPAHLPHEDRSTPSLIHDYSSSPSKHWSPYSSRPIPSSTLAAMNDEILAQSINSELSQRDERTSSQLKKPGVRKRANMLRADKTINPTRQAMLDSHVEAAEMVEMVMDGSKRRSAGKGANEEKLPFNRLERMRSGGSSSMAMDNECGYGGEGYY